MADLFDHIEIVADKSPKIYSDTLSRLGTSANYGVMIGNSLKSDIHPMLEAGGWAIYVPHPMTWEIEHAAIPHGHARFREEPDLLCIPAALEEMAKA